MNSANNYAPERDGAMQVRPCTAVSFFYRAAAESAVKEYIYIDVHDVIVSHILYMAECPGIPPFCCDL